MHKVFFSQLLLRRKLVVFPEVMLVFFGCGENKQRQTKIVVTCLSFIIPPALVRECTLNLCGAVL